MPSPFLCVQFNFGEIELWRYNELYVSALRCFRSTVFQTTRVATSEFRLNPYLLIFRDRIFDSKVEAGMPSLAAAPDDPDTLPLVWARAASINSLSPGADVSIDACSAERVGTGPPDSQLLSIVNSSVSQTISDRSITFCNSR